MFEISKCICILLNMCEELFFIYCVNPDHDDGASPGRDGSGQRRPSHPPSSPTATASSGEEVLGK